MKKKSLIKSSLILLSGMLILGSCGKTLTDSIQSAEDSALAEGTYNDVHQMTDEAATGSMSSYKTEKDASSLSACANITNDSISTPHVLTIDFGPVNCTCADGRNRRGKVIVSYTGRYRDAGSTHTITFDNYYVEDNHIMGTKTVTNMGLNTAGHSYFNVHVDGTIDKAGGGTITWASDRQREWIAGESTTMRMDDVYLITGTASGTTADGDHFTASITTPLQRALNCRWIESGVLEFTPDGKPTRTIDFGGGTCDNSASISVRGRSRNITLH